MEKSDSFICQLKVLYLFNPKISQSFKHQSIIFSSSILPSSKKSTSNCTQQQNKRNSVPLINFHNHRTQTHIYCIINVAKTFSSSLDSSFLVFSESFLVAHYQLFNRKKTREHNHKVFHLSLSFGIRERMYMWGSLSFYAQRSMMHTQSAVKSHTEQKNISLNQDAVEHFRDR